MAFIKSSHCGNLQWLPRASPGMSSASSHAMGFLCHSCPFLPPRHCVPHMSGLCPVFASSVCPLPGMFSRSSLLGYLLLQVTYGFLQENFLTTQTHLETCLVYSLLVPCSLVEHIHILTNYFSDNLFKACLHPLPITLKEEEVYLSCSSTQPKNLA